LGVDAPDGGDSTFGPDDNGLVLWAKGGKGAVAGTGVRSTSDKLIVSTLLLANHIGFRGIFAYITSTGFQHYKVLNLGDQLTFGGMTTLECGGVPVGEYALTLQALDPQNNVACSERPVFQISEPGDMLRMCFSFRLSVTVNMFGMWTIVAAHEGRELARLPIIVKQGVPD
jgi:hypothetical protein